MDMGKKKHMANSLQAVQSNSKTTDLKTSVATSADVWIICIHGLFVQCIYIYTMYPTIPGGDSGELITAAHELGVAHPPGYPVFTLMAWLAIKLVPLGSVAWRVNLLNAVLAAGASLVFSITIYRYTRCVGSAVLGSSLWSFCKLTWTWSVSAEVFGLNNLCVASLLYLMVAFRDAKDDAKLKVAYIGAFVSGLSLCNQHTIVVYVAVIAVLVLWELWNAKVLSVTKLVQLGMCFLLGLVPYIYLPLSSLFSKARWSWGDQSTLKGFMRHLLRAEYGTFDLAKGQNVESRSLVFSNLRGYVDHCISEYTAVCVVLAIVGIGVSIVRRCRCMSTVLAMCLLYLVMFSWRANLSLSEQLHLGVVERFWMQADMVFILFVTLGFFTVLRFLKDKTDTVSKYRLGLVLAVMACSKQLRNFADCNHRNNTVVWEFGSRLFHNMPQNALVLTVGDLPSNVLRYIYWCENDRPDVQVLDQELLSYSWFVPKLRHAYPNIKFPGHHMETQNGRLSNGQWVFNFRAFLNAHYDKYPIVGCIGMQTRETSWTEEFDTFPFGPCSLVARRGQPLHLERFLDLALNMSHGWTYPFQGFDGRTWERVATDEMWSAKTNIPLELYKKAVKLKETSQEYSDLMIRSYELYKASVDDVPVDAIPYYWHTNYALACERMMRLKHGYSKAQLLKDTIFHFEMTVEKKPDEKDVPIIIESIKELKKYVGVIK
ncbi:transmembrane protein 260-like isoform X2 [Dreissena polymorpha]|uniref:transmembrane protein 260-like isoform X2 n=1 Tax=Dreissena polymorpha TaxID=45954 RepID=UPI002264F39E|nr:transmembrane protein 260-like isoform X2 [Dreissena polymorpha]